MAEHLVPLPGTRVLSGAKVIALLRDGDDRVTGVRYRDSEGEHVMSADVVVGADGRFSRMRRMAALPTLGLGARTDLLWFRLPRQAGDPPDADVELYFGRDHYVGVLGG